MCYNPDQTAHYYTIGSKLGASSLTQRFILQNSTSEFSVKFAEGTVSQTNIFSEVSYPSKNISSGKRVDKITFLFSFDKSFQRIRQK